MTIRAQVTATFTLEPVGTDYVVYLPLITHNGP